MLLAIDFDSTIAFSDWPKIGPLVPGALESLRKLREEGHHITIWSARNNKQWGVAEKRRGMRAMRHFLDDNSVPYDHIDDGAHGKPVADLFVDDRNLGTPLVYLKGDWVVDWDKAYRMLQSLSRRDTG